MSQQDKIALVTGGAQGIGRAFCESLLEHGAKVAVCDVKEEVGKITVAELGIKYGNRVVFIPCDVTDGKQLEETFKTTIDKFGGLDIVINNAGIINETSTGWMRTVDINFKAAVVGTNLGFKYMGRNSGGRGGTIINLASIASLVPFPSLPVYSATKAALNQLSRSYGHELYFNKTGVKVICINPGVTLTSLVKNASQLLSTDPDIQKHFTDCTNSFQHQKPGNMGKGLIEILQKTENGALWTIENEDPPKRTVLK